MHTGGNDNTKYGMITVELTMIITDKKTPPFLAKFATTMIKSKQ
jgi:hypothetical protein